MIELTKDTLEQIIKSEERVIVQYGATWCGNCRIIRPKFKKLSDKHENITFVYVDAEKMPQARKLANVTNLPTFAAFRQGELIKEAQGNKIELVEGLVDEITPN